MADRPIAIPIESEIIPLNLPEFGFSQALVHLIMGLKVVDVRWTGEYLEITSCPSVTGNFIVKNNQGELSVFQPDAAAMLTARYVVIE